MKEWDYVLALTENELHSVTIIHDNADFIKVKPTKKRK